MILKYLSLFIFNSIYIFSAIPGNIAFDTKEEAVASGWVINKNNIFDKADETVIVKLARDEYLGYKWIYARATGECAPDNTWILSLSKDNKFFIYAFSGFIGRKNR